jgi:hypothetical protein
VGGVDIGGGFGHWGLRRSSSGGGRGHHSRFGMRVSLAHDMSGLGSRRSVRLEMLAHALGVRKWLGSEGWAMAAGGPAKISLDQRVDTRETDFAHHASLTLSAGLLRPSRIFG